MPPIKVHIEYCGSCGYFPKMKYLEADIKKVYPTAIVVGEAGRSKSFEVTVNGVPVHSKIKTGNYAKSDEVLANIQKIIQPANGEGSGV